MDTNSVPSVGQVLNERFLEPNGISQYRLAKAIGKPQATISNIILKDQGISTELAVLLGKALGTGTQYWIDVDTAYKLSKLENTEVEQLLDEQSDGALVESGGYTFTTRTINDAMLGRAVRGAVRGAVHIDPTEREILLDSVNKYIMYSTITTPGIDNYFEYKEDVPTNAIGIYEQFLINAGENPDEVGRVIHEARIEIYQNAGKTDIDGDDFAINRRSVKKVDIMRVGELMCASRELSDDGRNEIFNCLFSYAHDGVIVFPDNKEASDVFERFLSRCEGWGRAKELREIYDSSIRDNPENYDGNVIQLEINKE